MRIRLLRSAELVILFWALPFVYVLDLWPLHPFLLLLPVLGWCLVILLSDRCFDRARLWNVRGLRRDIGRILLVFVFGAAALASIVVLFEPQLLFGFVRVRPGLWALVMIFYPVVSVYPQEMVYRTFFFHRYRDLFPGRWRMIAASATTFGFMHIIFENGYAVILSLVGGWLFAQTYDRSRSTLAAVVEHGLYGCCIFTIGLGRYFYHGAVT